MNEILYDIFCRTRKFLSNHQTIKAALAISVITFPVKRKNLWYEVAGAALCSINSIKSLDELTDAKVADKALEQAIDAIENGDLSIDELIDI